MSANAARRATTRLTDLLTRTSIILASVRGTWISFGNRGELEITVEGDRRLFNQYGVMLVNPEKFPSVKKELGQSFVDWLISGEGQRAIAGYRIDGQQLFFPNAGKGS